MYTASDGQVMSRVDAAPSVQVASFAAMGLKLKIKKPLGATRAAGASSVSGIPAVHAPLSDAANGHILAQALPGHANAPAVAPSNSALSATVTAPVKKRPKLKLKSAGAPKGTKPLSFGAPLPVLSHPPFSDAPQATLHHPARLQPSVAQQTPAQHKKLQIKRSLPTPILAEMPHHENGLSGPEPVKKKPKLKLKAANRGLLAPKIEKRVVPVAPLNAMSSPVPAVRHTPLKLKLKPATGLKKIKIKQSILPSDGPAAAPAMKALKMPTLAVKVKRKPKAEPKAHSQVQCCFTFCESAACPACDPYFATLAVSGNDCLRPVPPWRACRHLLARLYLPSLQHLRPQLPQSQSRSKRAQHTTMLWQRSCRRKRSFLRRRS